MSEIENNVARLVPGTTGQPLLRGLLLGALVGAALAALTLFGRDLASQRARAPRPLVNPSDPNTPSAGEGSPL